jgi:BCCT family betaine/carnitine transporter
MSPRCADRGITAVALISVVRGLDGGVKRLSEINMVLAALLLVFMLLVGPTGRS